MGDGVFFLLGAEVGGEQVAGGVGAGVLGEVDMNGVIALGFTRVLSLSIRLHKTADVDAKGVGTADDFEQAAGGEFFH